MLTMKRLLAFLIATVAATSSAQNTFPASGNVGIGTTSPQTLLDFGMYRITSLFAGVTLENTIGDGNYNSPMLLLGSGPWFNNGQFLRRAVICQDNTVQTTAWNGVLQGGDYAEPVDVSGNRAEYEPGDVLVVDRKADGRFVKSSKPYSTAVMGISSTRPGVVGRRQKSDRSHMAQEVPMAMIGVVPTKVTDEGGAIEPGDLLVTSSKPGYAMKGSDHSQMMGAIIGKAIGHLESGPGLIEVAVSL